MAISLRTVSGCSLANLRVVTPTSQVMRGMRSAKWKITRYLSGSSVRIGSISGPASMPPRADQCAPPPDPAGRDRLDLVEHAGLLEREAQQQLAGRLRPGEA